MVVEELGLDSAEDTGGGFKIIKPTDNKLHHDYVFYSKITGIVKRKYKLFFILGHCKTLHV